MASNLKVNNILPTSGGGTVNLGASGDTITVPSGTTLNVSSATLSGITQGITMADQFRLTANLTSNADPISANLERVDDATFAKIGTGMSLSSGVYTFPTTGLYKVESTVALAWINDPDSIQVETYASSDSGSNYDQISRIAVTVNANDIFAHTYSTSNLVNVTDASTFRVKFVLNSLDANNYLTGNTDFNYTFFTFIRLGDSQ